MPDQKTNDTVLGGLRPSPSRRWAALLVLGGLGAMLVTLAMANVGVGLGLRLFLLTAGAIILWMVWRLWEATSHSLLLTRAALISTDGQVLAALADIASVERGLLSLSPAGGFSLVLHSPAPRAWRPGLWWRAGRRIGIGGVTNRHQLRYMADQIAALLAEGRKG